MGSAPDYVRKKYGPLLAKNLETALAHCIAQEFPRLGGPRIQRLCAQMLLEVSTCSPANTSATARSSG